MNVSLFYIPVFLSGGKGQQTTTPWLTCWTLSTSTANSQCLVSGTRGLQRVHIRGKESQEPGVTAHYFQNRTWPEPKARHHFFKEWVNYSLWISALHCLGSSSWIKYLTLGSSCITVLGKGQPPLGAWKVFWHKQHSKGMKSPLLQQAISSPRLTSWNRKEITACKIFPTHLKY